MVIAEKALIQQIRRMAKSKKNPAVVTGIGDDSESGQSADDAGANG